ncbi:MAG: hypothetical protein LBE36_06295 [Flavobacteriaceae bacterium]|nr:hypothetical protein [Flavobacteriaceae bacterium]
MEVTMKPTKNMNNSSVLCAPIGAKTARRKIFLQKRNLIIGFNFLKQNHGSFSVSRTSFGTYYATFSSTKTGRHTFAYGRNFRCACQNLIRLFNLKYSTSI